MRFTRLLTTTMSLIALLIPGPRLLSPALAQSPGNFSTLTTTGEVDQLDLATGTTTVLSPPPTLPSGAMLAPRASLAASGRGAAE